MTISKQIRNNQRANHTMIEYGKIILDLMKKDIQPMLIIIGDTSNISTTDFTSNSSHVSGSKISEAIHQLNFKDTKITVIDLNDEP